MNRIAGPTRIVMALLLGFATLFSGPFARAQEAATLSAGGTLNADYIIVTGTLTTASGPVAEAEIFGEVAGQWYYVFSNANGEFIMYLERPDGDAQSYEVLLLFEGNEAAAATELELTVGSSTPSQPEQRPDIELTISASLAAEHARPDHVVQINGTVADVNGAVYGGIQVNAEFNGRVHEESTTFTDDDGDFLTFVQIPPDEPEGQVSITLTTAPADGFTSASLNLTLTIRPPLEVPQHTTAPEGEPEPAESPTGQPDDQSDDQSDGEAAEESTTAPDVPAYHSGAWDWIWAVVAIAGGTAVLAVFFLMIRGMMHKRRDDGEEINLLGDDGLFASQDSAGSDVEVELDPAVEEAPPAAPKRAQRD